jgi:hypothetical protein
MDGRPARVQSLMPGWSVAGLPAAPRARIQFTQPVLVTDVLAVGPGATVALEPATADKMEARTLEPFAARWLRQNSEICLPAADYVLALLMIPAELGAAVELELTPSAQPAQRARAGRWTWVAWPVRSGAGPAWLKWRSGTLFGSGRKDIPADALALLGGCVTWPAAF